jgi:hypothetical protein
MEGLFMPTERCQICARVNSPPDDVCKHNICSRTGGARDAHQKDDGPPSVLSEDAILVSGKGVVPAIVTFYVNATWRTAHVAVAMKAMLADQRQVLLFETHPYGRHALIELTVPSCDLEKIHQHLLADGVESHTLVPRPDTTNVYVVTANEAADAAVVKFGERYDQAKANFQRGTAHIIGGDTRQEAQRVFEQIVSDFTRSGVH